MIHERIYDIVICFRMKDNESAILMKDWLEHRHYSVSVCSCNFGGGPWKDTMRRRVENCKDCILIISDDTFSRFSLFRKDYLIEEITLASTNGKRIIPIIKDPQGSLYIPRKIKSLINTYNQINYHYKEKNALDFCMSTLTGEESFLLSQPHGESLYYGEEKVFNPISDLVLYMSMNSLRK